VGVPQQGRPPRRDEVDVFASGVADARKRGVPPTDPYARTGEFTPPGMTFWARSLRESLRSMYLFSLAAERTSFSRTNMK
jgi:hypothetical protein